MLILSPIDLFLKPLRNFPSGFFERVIILNYSHLYNTNAYTPPSILRKMEESVGSTSKSAFGTTMMGGSNPANGVGVNNSLIQDKLRNKDVYRSMKHKTMYSTKSNIIAHASINSL